MKNLTLKPLVLSAVALVTTLAPTSALADSRGDAIDNAAIVAAYNCVQNNLVYGDSILYADYAPYYHQTATGFMACITHISQIGPASSLSRSAQLLRSAGTEYAAAFEADAYFADYGNQDYINQADTHIVNGNYYMSRFHVAFGE